MSQLFHPSDEFYNCLECGSKLRYSSWLASICEIGHDGQIISENHICKLKITKKRELSDDLGISSMQSERKAR